MVKWVLRIRVMMTLLSVWSYLGDEAWEVDWGLGWLVRRVVKMRVRMMLVNVWSYFGEERS